jgi:hypothetical protein
MQNIQVLGSSLSPNQAKFGWWMAKGVSIIFSPPLLGVISLVLVGLRLNAASDWGWLAAYGILTFVAPLLYLAALMRSGEVSDFHIKDRSERIKPLRVVLLLFFLCWLIFLVSGAPVLFQAFALMGMLQSAAIYLITLRWKISGHGAGAAGFSVLLWGLYGAAAAPAFLFIPLVIWARLALDRHDLAQTLAGSALGGVSMYLALVALPACNEAILLCASL